MCRLRHNKIQAARDVFYMAELLKVEEKISKGRNLIAELFTVPRNRRAMLASEIVMFMVCIVIAMDMANGYSNNSAASTSLVRSTRTLERG
jgi:hypothetical protein